MGEEKTKKGRRKKNSNEEYSLNTEQMKFFVDLSKDKESLSKLFEILKRANQKEYGGEITFKDIALYFIERLTQKDIEKIQELSLTEMERVERALNEYNQKNETKLGLGEFLVKKLSI